MPVAAPAAATRVTFRDVAQRIVGDVAIIRASTRSRVRARAMRPMSSSLTLRFTQVWVKRDGRWLREAFQATPYSAEENATPYAGS